jgi:hypothetical protein
MVESSSTKLFVGGSDGRWRSLEETASLRGEERSGSSESICLFKV